MASPQFVSAEALKSIAKGVNKPWYLKPEVWALIISIGGLVLNFYISQVQIKGIRNEINSKEIDYVLRFDDRLNIGPNYQISLLIENKKPLLRESGGQFMTSDLDLFLGTYNQLSDTYDNGLITEEALYRNFSDGIVKAYKNKEIQDYLQKIRIEDPDYFQGFDSLAKIFVN